MELILGSLATWRLAHMLSKEKGPLDIFQRFRAKLATQQKKMGGLFDMVSCVACCSIYIGAVTAIGAAQGVLEWLGYTLAFSAIAMFLERGYNVIRS